MQFYWRKYKTSQLNLDPLATGVDWQGLALPRAPSLWQETEALGQPFCPPPTTTLGSQSREWRSPSQFWKYPEVTVERQQIRMPAKDGRDKIKRWVSETFYINRKSGPGGFPREVYQMLKRVRQTHNKSFKTRKGGGWYSPPHPLRRYYTHTKPDKGVTRKENYRHISYN